MEGSHAGYEQNSRTEHADAHAVAITEPGAANDADKTDGVVNQALNNPQLLLQDATKENRQAKSARVAKQNINVNGRHIGITHSQHDVDPYSVESSVAWISKLAPPDHAAPERIVPKTYRRLVGELPSAPHQVTMANTAAPSDARRVQWAGDPLAVASPQQPVVLESSHAPQPWSKLRARFIKKQSSDSDPGQRVVQQLINDSEAMVLQLKVCWVVHVLMLKCDKC
jgi:hypothetical protein